MRDEAEAYVWLWVSHRDEDIRCTDVSTSMHHKSQTRRSKLPAPGYLASAANEKRCDRRAPPFSILLSTRAKKRRPWERLSFSDWCGWRDLNSHGYSHYRLKIARLPVPPQPRGREAVGSQVSVSCEPTFPLFRWTTTILCGAAGET